MSREFVLCYEARPWTQNAQRRMHYHEQARLVKEWREAFFYLVKEQRIPRLHAIHVVSQVHRKNGRWPSDVGAELPAAKAAIDALADAGVIPHDGPDYMKGLTFLPSVITGKDALELRVIEV